MPVSKSRPVCDLQMIPPSLPDTLDRLVYKESVTAYFSEQFFGLDAEDFILTIGEL